MGVMCDTEKARQPLGGLHSGSTGKTRAQCTAQTASLTQLRAREEVDLSRSQSDSGVG